MRRIAILIPCYNEEATIGKVITDFMSHMPWAEIYVYDNNSTDRTAEIAAGFKGVHVVPSPVQGKGAVVRQMLNEIDAEVYLMVDGDDTYPASKASDIITPVLRNHCDMVLGDRLSGSYFKTNTRPMHGFGNRLVRFLVNRLFDGNIGDVMTGYRAFNRDVAKGFVSHNDGFEVETELSIWALKHHKSIKSESIAYKERPDGSVSKLDTISDGKKILKCIFDMKKNKY